SCTEIEHIDFPERGEVVHRLVDGPHRHRRHLGPSPVVNRLDRGVRVVTLEQPEDHLPLRRDPEPPFPEEIRELVAGLPDTNSFLTTLVENQIGARADGRVRSGSREARPMLVVGEILRNAAVVTPDAVAATLDDRAITFGQIESAGNRIARRLLAM